MAKGSSQSGDLPAISIIASDTVIEGNMTARGDVRIDGTVKGKVNVEGKLVLGPSGTIEGEVIAKQADISGCVQGNITIEGLLTLKSSCNITGDMNIGKLSIEPGALFNGKCIMNTQASSSNS